MINTILAERLRRQRLTDPLPTTDGYLDLFRLLQPVSPICFTRPGDPPRLVARTRFDDGSITNRLRAQRTIVKGRFLGGSIGYVLADDLALYANAFCKPLPWPNDIQQTVLESLQTAGPLTPRQLKEETGLLNKQIMPALHRLQEAFLVYEDQTDEDWERGWYDFATEWPDVNLDESQRQGAAVPVILRFLEGHVFATLEQLKDWTHWPTKFLVSLTQEMARAGLIAPAVVTGLGEGWLSAKTPYPCEDRPPPSVFMLHQADLLVKSHLSELKRRFAGLEVLQYLLIDGQFQGAVTGHWRIGPHDVDDIVLTLPAAERANRHDQILRVVSDWYHPPHSRILQYAGETV